MSGPTPDLPRAPLLQRLSGSKILSAVSLVVGALATLCLTMPGEVEVLSPEWGRRVCAFIAILSFLGSTLGKGLFDQREAGPVSEVRGFKAASYASPLGDRRKR